MKITMLIFISMTGFFCRIGYCVKYPVLTNQNTDIVYLENPNVHFAVEEWAIDNAKSGIYFTSYLLYDDPTGMRTMKALRRAADRGIPLYLITEKMGDQSPALYLADKGLKVTPVVVENTRLKKLLGGLTLYDMIHKKTVMIDPGTSSEITFTGGRNHNDIDKTSLDSGFAIRPIDASKPSIGTYVKRDFEKFWHFLKKTVGTEKGHYLNSDEPKNKNKINIFMAGLLKVMKLDKLMSGEPSEATKRRARLKLEEESVPFLVTDKQKVDYHKTIEILSKKPVAGESLAENQFRPKSIQYVTNDMLEIAKNDGASWRRPNRERLPNDINDVISENILASEKAAFHGYAFAPSKPLEKSLAKMVENGGVMEIFVNGRKISEKYFKDGMLVYYYYENALRLMRKTRGNYQNITLNTLDKDKTEAVPEENPFYNTTYVHRKQLLLNKKDGKKLIITGSDPMTNSTWFNDESIYVIEDARMSAYLEALTESERFMYTSLNRKEIERRNASVPTILYGPCKALIFGKIL